MKILCRTAFSVKEKHCFTLKMDTKIFTRHSKLFTPRDFLLAVSLRNIAIAETLTFKISEIPSQHCFI